MNSGTASRMRFVAIGMVLGTGLGVVFHNIALGSALGLVIGLLAGILRQGRGAPSGP